MAEIDLNTTHQTVMSRRGLVELVPVTDTRVTQVLTQTEACICGEMDGPQFFVIGARCDAANLVKLAKREGIHTKRVMHFRNSLEAA